MGRSFNLYLGLLQVIAWLFWRLPVTAQKPLLRPPRRPHFNFITGSIPKEIHSIVRLSWMRNGKTLEVDEFQILESEEALIAFQYAVGQALRNGIDVSVLTTYSPKDLGVPNC